MAALLFCIILILLGALGAASVIEARLPASVTYIVKIRPHEEVIGLVGIIVGICAIIDVLFNIGYFIYMPAIGLLTLAAGFLMLFLGLIFGLVFISKRLRDPAVSFPVLPGIEAFRARLLPYQKEMGEGAIVCGIIFFCIFVMRLFQ